MESASSPFYRPMSEIFSAAAVEKPLGGWIFDLTELLLMLRFAFS